MEKASDSSQIKAWYNNQLRQFGNSHKGLGWNRIESQVRRFAALAEIGSFSGRAVLDVGCGLGDFLVFLSKRSQTPVYHGLDICPEMINACRRRFAGRMDCLFTVGDILDFQPERRYDYVVASGIFGLRTDNALSRIAPTLERMYASCREATTVNFLSSAAQNQTPGRLYCDPGEILDLGLKIAPRARLDHHYLPNDFTLMLFRG